MSQSKKVIYSLNIITATLLLGCGGSSEESIVTLPQQELVANPSSSKVSSAGVITGFGSVYVDGVKYNTDAADININGKSGSDISSLKVGMHVTVTSSDDGSESPEASTVSYESEVEGVITAIDRGNQTIIIAGTLISYNNLTHFIDTTEANLTLGQRVEVNGYLGQDNSYLATMIKLDSDTSNDDSQYTRGLIEQLDTTNKTFRLDQLTIDYNSASVEGELSNGALVKVAGVLTNQTITASSIELEIFGGNSDSSSDDISHYELEGMISAFDATSRIITVNGFSFTLTDAVQYEGGAEDTLAAGVFVELKLSDTKEVVRIEFDSEKYRFDGKIKGVIEQIDLDNQLITMHGVEYQIGTTTRFEDDDEQYFSLLNLQVDDFVELVFAKIDEVKVIQRIEREKSDEFNDEWEIEGPISAYDVDTSSITVNGVSILLNSNSLYLNQGIVIELDDFFTGLALGTFVEIEGYYDSNAQLVIEKLKLGKSDEGEEANDSSDDQNDSSDDQDDSSNDAGQGYVEIEGRVSELLSATSFTLNNYEIRLDESAKLELNGQNVTLVDFMNATSVNIAVEVEGVWVENTYIRVTEAEIESNENDD